MTINNFQDNFQGRGELRIENTSNQALTLYMPVGTVFPAPSAEFQSMAGYATDVQVENANAQQQAMPETGASDLTLGQMATLVLLGLNIVALGFVLRRRALA